jgi:hypothetical protein
MDILVVFTHFYNIWFLEATDLIGRWMVGRWYFALWSLRIPDVQLQPWRHCKDINLMKLIMTHMHCASHLLDIQALVGLLVMIHIEGVEIVLMITTSDLEEAVTKIHFASNAGVSSIL